MIKAHDGRAAVLRALEHSGLSMAEFCRRRGLAYATVAGWRNAARRSGGTFVEVEAQGGAGPPGPQTTDAAALCVELALPGGAVLRVYQRGAQGGTR